MRINTVIIGSCVSRDCEWMSTSCNFNFIDYFARTSMATSFTEPFALTMEEIDKKYTFSSAFQRNMVNRDISRALSKEKFDDFNGLIILDFVDDRFSLLSIGGTNALFSAELQQTGIKNWAENASIIDPHSDTHFDLWRAGLERFVGQIRDRRRIVVNGAFYAAFDNAGVAFDVNTVRVGNDVLTKRYSTCETLGLKVLYSDKNSILADANHRWARAPFHYTREYYDQFVKDVNSYYCSL